MIRSRYYSRLFLGYVLLVSFTAVAIAVTVSSFVAERSRSDTERSLRWLAEIGAEASIPAFDGAPNAKEKLRRWLKRRGESTGVRFTVVTYGGMVLGDSHFDADDMGNHRDRPEFERALADGYGIAERLSRTLGEEFVYVAIPVSRGRGFVRAALPLASIRQQLAELRMRIALVSLIAVVLAFGIGYELIRRTTRRIVHLTASVESMAQGNYRQKLSSGSTDEIGNLIRSFNLLAVELQRRVDALDGENRKLSTILSSMIEGVIAVDQEERVVHLNAAASEILEVETPSPIGKPLWEITRQREVAEAVSHCLKAGRSDQGEASVFLQTRERILELRADPLTRTGGELIGAVLVFHDVTELRRLESMRREFVTNVSHELKTPITAARGLVETIVDDPEMPRSTQESFLQKMINQLERLSVLVSDLLTIARLESGDQYGEAMSLDLRQPCRAAMRTVASLAEQKGVEIQFDLPEEPVPFRGDGEALQQAVTNLLDNAIKYSMADRVELGMLIEDREAVITVRDDGIGIGSDHLERLFERFYRVDKARSRELGGTGLGLSIVKHVCRVHDGDATVESAPGQGATFRLRFPLGEKSAS
ncbi:MAG: ATP-binding protein [Planctomycetota bacterium]